MSALRALGRLTDFARFAGNAAALPRAGARIAQVIAPAIKLADEGGIESLSMRNVAQELGVYPMALYNHFANKDDLLDAMVDAAIASIEMPRRASWRPRAA